MTEKAKVVNYYQELSKTYDKKRLGTEKSKLISELQTEWFVKNLENKNAIVCLEIGCGTGRLTKELIKKTRILVATDTSHQMIKFNKNKIDQSFQKNKMHYVICDASHLPFHNKTFTNIASARVFWHIQDYPQVLKETFRVLNKNGLLLFDFPCLWGLFSLYSKLRGIKHDVLTLFIDEKTIKQIFKKTKNLSIHGNTSLILYFVPNKLLKMKTIKNLIYLLEIRNKTFLKNRLYAYYLIKVTK